MSISKLPSGRYRAQVYDPATRSNVSVAKVLGLTGRDATFATKRDAKAARETARAKLGARTLQAGPTVAEFRDRWLTDPLFRRPKQSSMIHMEERTKAFAERYGHLPIREITDEHVSEWLRDPRRASTVPKLRAMFNDAARVKAGRLVDRNPFAGLGLEQSKGNRDKQPPSEEMVWTLIANARELSSPYMAAWLQVACFTGMRPGELDALRWENVDFAAGRVTVMEQWNASSRTITLPKNGLVRPALLTPPAREALLSLPREQAHCFVNLRGGHMTASSRAYHWKAIRSAAGWDGSLYLATRHFAGWYMVNVLGLASEDVAIALGHEDGGELVRRLYGHRDRHLALSRVAAAYEGTGNVKPLRVVREDTA